MANSDHWSKFVWSDWRGDSELIRCSHAAKGIWMDALAVAFECEVPGVFQTAGKPWPLDDIAKSIPGGDFASVLLGLNELIERGILKQNSSGAYYSKRMFEEGQLRKKRASAGRKGGKASKQNASKTQANSEAKGEQTLSNSNSNSFSSEGGMQGGDLDPSPDLHRAAEVIAAYPPLRIGPRHAANRAAAEALAYLCAERGMEQDAATDWLAGRTRMFAESVRGASSQFIPLAKNWFPDGGYDQTPDEWRLIGRDGASEGERHAEANASSQRAADAQAQRRRQETEAAAAAAREMETALASLSDSDLAALKSRALAALPPASQRQFEKSDPKTSRPLRGVMYAHLKRERTEAA